jgi:hypothetical protein
MISPTELPRLVNHALTRVPPGSIEMYNGLRSEGNVYSLKMPVLGKKTNTFFFAVSVPKTITDPDIVVTARLVGFELGVGIVHSRNVSVDGSR